METERRIKKDLSLPIELEVFQNVVKNSYVKMKLVQSTKQCYKQQ